MERDEVEATGGSGAEDAPEEAPAAGRPRTEGFRILFVCTGNTCRSPMAEVIARREIEERGWRHVEVASAGVSAFPGMPASEEAVVVAGESGLDLARHQSTPLTAEGVERADLVLVMAGHHLEALRSLGGAEKGTLLSAFAAGEEGEAAGTRNVPDPIGGTREAYAETFRTLERLVRDALRRLEPIVAP